MFRTQEINKPIKIKKIYDQKIKVSTYAIPKKPISPGEIDDVRRMQCCNIKTKG
jgi:hypothetical protein